jgi:hypothetical protein
MFVPSYHKNYGSVCGNLNSSGPAHQAIIFLFFLFKKKYFFIFLRKKIDFFGGLVFGVDGM